eukprot:2703075-Prymnesium_polylepis.3
MDRRSGLEHQIPAKTTERPDDLAVVRDGHRRVPAEAVAPPMLQACRRADARLALLVKSEVERPNGARTRRPADPQWHGVVAEHAVVVETPPVARLLDRRTEDRRVSLVADRRAVGVEPVRGALRLRRRHAVVLALAVVLDEILDAEDATHVLAGTRPSAQASSTQLTGRRNRSYHRRSQPHAQSSRRTGGR